MLGKPTILVANGLMDAGGTESLLMEMFRHSSGRVNYILLVHYQGAVEKGLYDDEIRSLGITIKHIPAVGSIGINRYVQAFHKTVKEIGHIDIVHSHLNGNGGIISLAAKKAGIPVRICHCHADIHFTGSLLNRCKEEILLQLLRLLIEANATGRWACSDVAWKRLFYPWHKKFIVSNMIDVRKYLGHPEDKLAIKSNLGLTHSIVLGSVGRVVPIKNIETAIRATAMFVKAGYDAEYVCFGRFDLNNSYCKSLIELAESLSISDRIRFMGNSDNIAEDIKCIDIFLMPSFTEGFGIAALEAQAAGIPCLLSNGIPAKVNVGVGLVEFLEPNDVQAWTKAMERSLSVNPKDNDYILTAFAKAGLDSVSGVEQIENKYLEIVNGK